MNRVAYYFSKQFRRRTFLHEFFDNVRSNIMGRRNNPRNLSPLRKKEIFEALLDAFISSKDTEQDLTDVEDEDQD
jgi:hypothetical protein